MTEWSTCPKCGAPMVIYTGYTQCPLCGYKVPVRTITTTTGTSVEYVPVRHGKWLYGESESGHDGYYCSQCGKHIRWRYGEEDINFIRLYNYCPHCGAKMDEVNDG